MCWRPYRCLKRHVRKNKDSRFYNLYQQFATYDDGTIIWSQSYQHKENRNPNVDHLLFTAIGQVGRSHDFDQVQWQTARNPTADEPKKPTTHPADRSAQANRLSGSSLNRSIVRRPTKQHVQNRPPPCTGSLHAWFDRSWATFCRERTTLIDHQAP